MTCHSRGILGLDLGLILATLTFVACDGNEHGSSSSGVDRSKYFDQLTAEEVKAICTWDINVMGGPRSFSCDGSTGRIGTLDECTATPHSQTTHCQVGLWEDCINSVQGDPCQLYGTAACKVFVSCEYSRD